MNVVAIIQARMNSTRLPKKVLVDLHGHTMLSRIIRRASRSRLVRQVVVATTTSEADLPIAEECRRVQVPCFLGDERDVLDRYLRTALEFHADVVVRITSDCPLIDPEVIDQVVDAFLTNSPDYAANTLRRSFPRGLDTEVMSVASLDSAAKEALLPYQRTHVTPFIYQHPKRFRLLPVSIPMDYSERRWTVSTQADLAFARAIYARFEDDTFSWRDVITLLQHEPWIEKLNQGVRQKRLMAG